MRRSDASENRQISNLNFAFGENTLLLLSTAYIYHHVTFTRYLLLQKKTTGHFLKLLHLTDISLTWRSETFFCKPKYLLTIRGGKRTKVFFSNFWTKIGFGRISKIFRRLLIKKNLWCPSDNDSVSARVVQTILFVGQPKSIFVRIVPNMSKSSRKPFSTQNSEKFVR